MIKATFLAAVLAAMPSLALALCDDMRRKPDGSLCPEKTVYDADFDVCIEAPAM